MKIIIDLQGLQREGNRRRGIGRYCLEFTKALINYYPENEYILFTNSALCDLRHDFFDEFNNKKLNLVYFECPIVGDINQSYIGIYSKLWLSTQLRSYSLSIINADIILITSFFDGFRDNTLVSHDSSFKLPPIVSIVYDFIPLVHADQYLNFDPEYKLFYLEKIKELSKLDGLLTISESSRKEASQYLEINPEVIFNISSACDEKKFLPSNSKPNLDEKSLGSFILYCGAIDPRKNLYRLIDAYASLPLDLIVKHKLVLTGPYTKEESLLVKEWMISFGLPPEYIVFLGFVEDFELADLYRSCHLFVFPSLHEGFGLPVLEAMISGAPVIASKLTSLPELIGNQNFLFDPYDPKDISSLIYKSLTNKEFYQSICNNSKERSKRFSWKYTCETSIKSFEKVLKRNNNFSNKNQIDHNDLMQIKYNILKNNLFKSPFIRLSKKSSSQYLRAIASAISIIHNQSNKIQLMRRVKNKENLTWHIEGPFDSSYSLAILNRNYALAMDKLGQNVLLFSTEGPGDYEPNSKFLDQNPLVNKLYQNSINAKDRFFICTRNLYPPRVIDTDGVVNLLHAYGWEESEFPQQWVVEFNTYLQGITVMSKFVKKILIDNGVKIPISVSGLGLDHIDKLEAEYAINIKLKEYKILHVSSCFERKGIDTLLKAYGQAFNIHDNVTLIIKTFPNPHNKVNQILEELIKNNRLFPHVVIILDDYSDKQLKGLYLQSNLLVAPSRGEGFGLPIGEAMRLGIPVITTGWGGQLDFVNNKNSWLIDYKFMPSESHFALDQSYWADPCVNHLCELLLEVFNSSDIAIKSKTIAAREITSSLTWEAAAKKNIDFVQNQLGIYDNSSIKFGCISTWNSKCGIASYSKNLLKNLNEEVIVFSPFDEVSSSEDNIQVIPSWDLGKSSNCQNLIKEISSNNINWVLIQFNYGFFDFSDLSDLIFNLKKKSKNVIILLHATKDPENNNSKLLFNLKKALQNCARVLVHSIEDLNRLKKLNIIDNACLFPHGIVDYEPNNFINSSLKSTNKTITISTFGFCLPNKGFRELIEAVRLLRDRGLDVKLVILSAIYSDDYYWVYEDLVRSVSELRLKDYVSIDNRYLNTNEILENLSLCDCLVFPYQSSNESSSASVRTGLATLKPTFVTPLDIFDDVSDLVTYLPGFSPREIANTLFEFFDNSNNGSTNLKIDSNKIFQLIKMRRFSKVSNRLIDMIKSLEINKSI